MYPLFPLAALAANIEHVDAQLSHGETRLVDTRCLGSCAQHIINVWYIVLSCYALGLLKETMTLFSIMFAES
jgi:hypothetical protein